MNFLIIDYLGGFSEAIGMNFIKDIFGNFTKQAEARSVAGIGRRSGWDKSRLVVNSFVLGIKITKYKIDVRTIPSQ